MMSVSTLGPVLRGARCRPAAFLRRGLGLLALLAVSLAHGAAIEDIRFASLPNDVTEIRLDFDGAVPDPAGYTIDQPARIAIDLMGATSSLDSKYHTLGTGNTRSVTVVEAADRTRVIINLTELVGYETRVEGQSLLVRVGTSVAGGPMGPGIASRPEATTREAAAGSSEITDIDFRRGDQGQGQVIISLSDPKALLDVRSAGNDIRVEIAGTAVPEALRRRLDVTDFATPVELIDTMEEAGRAVITIRPIGDYEYLAYQADETITVDVRPVSAADGAGRVDDVFRYKGEKLSLNFQDIEVRSVLQLIADFTNLNLVASDTVAGRITLRLQNVPWDQALDIILRNKGLDKRQMGNVLMVAPAAEIAAREQQELDNRRQIQELAPLRTEFIQVLYADAQQLVGLFQAAGEGEAGLLSERGSVIVDDRTNSIIISETADKIIEIRRLLQQLDIPVRQVLIEARIVNANTNFSESLGVRWGGAGRFNSDGQFVSIGSQSRGLQQGGVGAPGGGGGAPGGGGGGLIGAPPITPDGDLSIGVPNFNFPVTNPTSQFSIGIVGNDYILDLELSALASEGNGEIVARPKVITADQQTATIESGTQIPFQEATSAGATAVSFQDAVLSLEVTPQITPDNRVIMDLQVNQDEVGQIFNGVPSIDTNAVTTQVLVDNGQTVVLGGIFRNTATRAVDKTPVLGDMPYIGRLFRRTIETQDKRELLVFITPRIIDDALTRR